ncbi:MAG: hypothetical protein HYZ33_02140, partial [Ignavibacteriales bacterium]|nr:hypothetical protein [Ignavibacteriales bacterium]
MKQVSLLFIIILSVTFVAFPQTRVLVSPNDEVIPLKKGESAVLEVAKRNGLQSPTLSPCSNEILDGYTPSTFSTNSDFGAYQNDVLGQWFVARFNGRIDTLFWIHFNDSFINHTLTVRIFRSNINLSRGPGIVPFPPPCTPWGYFQNTYMNEISPFKKSNDDYWVSTVSSDSLSFPPFGEEIWKQGGDTISLVPGLNQLALTTENDSVVVQRGDVLFITMQVNEEEDSLLYGERIAWANAGFSSLPPEYQEYYPSRNWKYYTGYQRPSNCAGQIIDSLPLGWLARGGLSDDTLDVAAYNWWYSISTIDNTPPRILSSTTLDSMLCNADSICLAFEIEDCDPSNPVEAGVQNVKISWRADGDQMPDIPCTNSDSNTWIGCIPRVYPCMVISWTVEAIDTKGLVSSFPEQTIRICSMNNEYATVDTSTNCPISNIAGTGNFISPESFFNAPGNLLGNPMDNGTAGPFPLGGVFRFYGKELRYAWVGVNGAIALSETATETLDVNSNGHFTSSWDFPGTIRSHTDPRDRTGLGRKPPNFIAPFWNDWLYKDTLSNYRLGSIYWDTVGCKFIVQYDSLGLWTEFEPWDEYVFRVILDRCDGTIEFQYDHIGVNEVEKTALIGFQADSIRALGNQSPWVFINKNSARCSPLPHNGSCFRIHPSPPLSISDKWNMISVLGEESTKVPLSWLFPSATNPAFRFEGGNYVPYDSLEPGVCYWIKPNSSEGISIGGSFSVSCNVDLYEGWNMVSSCVSCQISTSSIDNPLVLGQNWFGYNNGY